MIMREQYDATEENDDWLDWLNLYETAYFSVDHAWLSPGEFEQFINYFAIVLSESQ